MSAVVENNENPDQKRSRQSRQRNRQPIGHREAQIHQIPKQTIRDNRVHNLPKSAPERGLLVLGNDLFPGRGVGGAVRSEEHTSELQSLTNLVCRLLLEKK